MSSRTVADHIESVRALSKPGEALAPDAPTATVNNPDWWRDGEPTPSRRRLHDTLIDRVRSESPGVGQFSHAVILAGPPGAGKGKVLEQVLKHERATHLVIDPDRFKQLLLEVALRDGSYNDWILPDEIRKRTTAGEKFFPMELAALVHEESSHLAKALRREAISERRNLVIDSVLSNLEPAIALGVSLEKAGYSIRVIDVEVPFELSQKRIRSRWEKQYLEALKSGPNGEGNEHLGGRWVPSEYAREVFDGPNNLSKPEMVARRLANDCEAVTQYSVYRSTESHPDRVLDIDMQRAEPGAKLLSILS